MTTGSALTTYIMNNGLFVGLALIAFLVINEVLSTDTNKNEKIKTFITIIKISIIPLFLIFIIVVTYNALTVLSNP
ncbi:MAG: hypothetical protein WAK14_09610 [Methanobacterium sp.]